MDLRNGHSSNYLASADISIPLQKASSPRAFSSVCKINELDNFPYDRAGLASRTKNRFDTVFASNKGLQKNSQEVSPTPSLSMNNIQRSPEENQRGYAINKSTIDKGTMNQSLRSPILEESFLKTHFNIWAFDINESYNNSEINFCFTNDMEQNLDDLSGYQEFHIPKEKSITLIKCEIECEEQIKEEEDVDPIIKYESVNDNILLRKLEENEYVMAKEECLDFNQAMMIHPFLDSFSNWLVVTSQQALSLPNKSQQKHRLVQRTGGKPQEVSSHFLKVHLKKCFNYALFNSMEVYDILSAIYRENQASPSQVFQQQMQSFLFEKLKEFNEWLENLKRTLRDSKDDFKAAYLVNHKELQCEILNLEQEDIPVFISNKSRQWDIIIFKMALRLVSLKFIHDTSERGLRFQLKNANNITIEEEHQRYVVLTEWLIEKPSRIDYSEVFGKRWVAHFFEAREKRNKELV